MPLIQRSVETAADAEPPAQGIGHGYLVGPAGWSLTPCQASEVFGDRFEKRFIGDRTSNLNSLCTKHWGLSRLATLYPALYARLLGVPKSRTETTCLDIVSLQRHQHQEQHGHRSTLVPTTNKVLQSFGSLVLPMRPSR